jgi:hypothetical protein
MTPTTKSPFPFECENCGHKPTPQEVIDHHGDCSKCRDTVSTYTVDAAEYILASAISAARECDGMACIFDVLAGRATEDDHKSGEYGNWCHDSEVLRMAARILRRKSEMPNS